MGLVPPEDMQRYLGKVWRANAVLPEVAEREATEEAAVEAAITALSTLTPKPLPQNMFAPFTVLQRAKGALHESHVPTVHWANVDTGSMVNLVYSGVLSAFPKLQQYREPFNHVVYGIGGATQRITGKLVGVPVSLGAEQEHDSCVYTTFYVLDSPAYHWLFGLPMLSSIDGAVYCKARVLHYHLGSHSDGAGVALPLYDRSSVHQQPVYLHFNAHHAPHAPLHSPAIITPASDKT